MNHTKQTAKKHLSPGVLIIWFALVGLAWCADRGTAPWSQEQSTDIIP